MTGAVPSTEADENLAQVVRHVLLVARLGETDQRGWWGTSSFGAAGRVVLKQRLPRTWRMAAIELDVRAAANRHDEIIDRRTAVHLFSDHWPVRRWASAWVAEQKTADPPNNFFDELESVDVDEVVRRLPSDPPEVEVSGNAARVGFVSAADFGSSEVIAEKVAMLAAVYPQLEDGFAVPYLEITE